MRFLRLRVKWGGSWAQRRKQGTRTKGDLFSAQGGKWGESRETEAKGRDGEGDGVRFLCLGAKWEGFCAWWKKHSPEQGTRTKDLEQSGPDPLVSGKPRIPGIAGLRPPASAAPGDFTQKGGARGLRTEQPPGGHIEFSMSLSRKKKDVEIDI